MKIFAIQIVDGGLAKTKSYNGYGNTRTKIYLKEGSAKAQVTILRKKGIDCHVIYSDLNWTPIDAH